MEICTIKVAVRGWKTAVLNDRKIQHAGSGTPHIPRRETSCFHELTSGRYGTGEEEKDRRVRSRCLLASEVQRPFDSSSFDGVDSVVNANTGTCEKAVITRRTLMGISPLHVVVPTLPLPHSPLDERLLSFFEREDVRRSTLFRRLAVRMYILSHTSSTCVGSPGQQSPPKVLP